MVPGGGALTTVHVLQASSLYYFTFAFFKSRKSRQLIFWETQEVFGFLFFFHLRHILSEKYRETADPAEIKPFSPPIRLESRSILNDFPNRRWFVSVPPLESICRIQRSKGRAAFLRWALISWTRARSLNSSSRETPVPAENGPLFHRRHSWVKIGASHWPWLKQMSEIRYKEIGMIGFYSNHDDWQRPSASEQNPVSHRGYCIQL